MNVALHQDLEGSLGAVEGEVLQQLPIARFVHLLEYGRRRANPTIFLNSDGAVLFPPGMSNCSRAQSPLLVSYTPNNIMERVNGIAPLSRPWHGRILLLNHTRKNGSQRTSRFLKNPSKLIFARRTSSKSLGKSQILFCDFSGNGLFQQTASSVTGQRTFRVRSSFRTVLGPCLEPSARNINLAMSRFQTPLQHPASSRFAALF